MIEIQSEVKPKGYVEIYVIKDGDIKDVYKNNNVEDAGKNLLASFLFGETVKGIKCLAVLDINGEFSRHLPTQAEKVATNKLKYTFYLNENEANTIITQFKLCADSADLTLNTGIYYATIDYNREKSSGESYLIYWYCEVM